MHAEARVITEAPCREDAGGGVRGEGEGDAPLRRRSRDRAGRGQRVRETRTGKGVVEEKVNEANGCTYVEGTFAVVVVVIAGVSVSAREPKSEI